MTMTPRYLFTYGSLRSGGRGAHLVSKYGKVLCKAMVNGLLYDVGDFPAFHKHDDSLVYGEVIELWPNADLRDVDEYEGVDVLNPAQGLYRRESITAMLITGNTVDAWVYVWNQPIKGLKPIEGGDYHDYLKKKSAYRMIR